MTTRFRSGVPLGALALGMAVGAVVASALFYRLVVWSPEVVDPAYQPRGSHADYVGAIQALGVAETELASRWLAAAEAAAERTLDIAPPFSETMVFDPARAEIAAYRFPVTRGRAISVTITAPHDRYFADILRYQRDGETVDELVASHDPATGDIVFEARSNGFYLLRLQPELLRGGQFTIRIDESASLAFPVEGAGPSAIWSFYGDSRDGGRRDHHGVDIFAPRGTPVVAASDSRVVRVGTRDRGGKVVVLHDERRSLMLYYAHLDEHRATEGELVSAGTVIGTVGNTGNAITTPPHLHIGIYLGGWGRPIDPWPFFVAPEQSLAESRDSAGASRAGSLARPVDRADPVATSHLGRFGRISRPVSSAPSLVGRTARRPDQRNRNRFLSAALAPFHGGEAAPPTAQSWPQAGSRPRVGELVTVTAVGRTHARLAAPDGQRYLIAAGDLGAIAFGQPVEVEDAWRLRELWTGDRVPSGVLGGTALLLNSDSAGAFVVGSGRVLRID